jgi:hypothetical protein
MPAPKPAFTPEIEQMDIDKPPSRERDPLLRWFATAHYVVANCDPSAERTLALRDLIASKDNAVRALLETPKVTQS